MMEKHNDVYKARALRAYMMNAGDLAAVRAIMGEQEEKLGQKPPTKARLEKWEEEYGWKMWLIEMQNVLQSNAAKDAINEMKRNISFIGTLKSRLMEEVLGRTDDEGNYTTPRVNARSLESAATAFCKLVETEMMLRGDTPSEKDKKKSDGAVLTLLGKAMKSANSDKDTRKKNPRGDSADSTGVTH